MNCPYCGAAHLPEHGIFCASCGLRIGRAVIREPSAAETATPGPRPRRVADDDRPTPRCPVCGIASTTRPSCPECGCELLRPPGE